MKIETNRCRLSPIQTGDKIDVYQLYKSDKVRQFLGGPIDKITYDERFSQFTAASETIHWTIRLRESHEFVGLVSISKHHDGLDHEISYQLLPQFWGQGLAREVINAALEYAVATLNLTHILAETQSGNIKSKTLLMDIGMEPVTTITRFGKEQIIYRKRLTETGHHSHDVPYK